MSTYSSVVAALALLFLGGRRVIDLNEGWEFARVPTPPSIWNGSDSVSRQHWRVLSVSSEETFAENADAAKALDGDPRTFWHSEWKRSKAPYPHFIVIDLGAPTVFSGIRILPRQTSPHNGRPKRFRLFVDGIQVLEDGLADSTALYDRRFPRTTARTLRLEFIEGQNPEPFLAIAEIGLIRPSRQGTDWSSQYNVERMTGGHARSEPAANLDGLRQRELNSIHAWQKATLPHAAWARPLDDAEIWQGVTYYRRTLPTVPSGQRALLTLQGIQSLDLWLNGRHIGERRGGYLPLRMEIRQAGNLLVRADNRDDPLTPPGKPQAQLDFMYGNGLVGNASLETTDPLHIGDALDAKGGVRIGTVELGRTYAVVPTRTTVVNDSAVVRKFSLRSVILDPSGRQVQGSMAVFRLDAGKSSEFTGRFQLTHPALWSPDSPSLYRLRTTILERGRIVDDATTQFGIRTIEVSRDRGFVLNGKPVRLIGTNRHQDYPWIGPALSDAAQWRDALMIKLSGHNIVRLSHYNQSPAFLDACDSLGLLTIPCIPGWQFINDDPIFRDRVLRDIRETVRRDRNHPSVAFWEVSLNETYPPPTLARTWHDTAKAEGANLTAGDEGRDVPWDVTYNGWRDDLSRPSNSTKPGYIREYGDYEFGGATSTSRVRLRDGWDHLLQETWNHVWSLNRFRTQYPSTMGLGTWEMFDHNVPWDFAVSASGLVDLMRREKPSFWFFASQGSRGPYLRIAADWQHGPAVRTVVVFTNAERADLFVNGRLVQSQHASRGPEAPYRLDAAFNGTDTANLDHPPIVFHGVRFEPGELKVVASNGSRAMIRTAFIPSRLKVWIDDLGIPPTTNDCVFVRAAIVDAHGTMCSAEGVPVEFSGAQFAGERRVISEMGIASVLVRTPASPQIVSVHARAKELSGSCKFSLRTAIQPAQSKKLSAVPHAP